MKIVEISASLGNDLKRYNSLKEVSISEQPFEHRIGVLYGITKPTDIVQTNAPTNILVDIDGNPIGNSQPFYFGIRVYPFISADQKISCNNNIISYGEIFGLQEQNYFTNMEDIIKRGSLPEPYTGELYLQPTFVQSLPYQEPLRMNCEQAMQQFVNDCVFPTKPNLDLPGQSQSADREYSGNNIAYFALEVYQIEKNVEPKGILNVIQVKDEYKPTEYKKYMVQFDGQNLNFKFGMAVNSDFAEVPNIVLPYLYRTYVALLNSNSKNGICMGVIMQCLLYDSNGNVISA